MVNVWGGECLGGERLTIGETNIIIDTETSINKVDVDMNSLVKAMIKRKTNLINDTETSINMVDDCLNYLVLP